MQLRRKKQRERPAKKIVKVSQSLVVARNDERGTRNRRRGQERMTEVNRLSTCQLPCGRSWLTGSRNCGVANELEREGEARAPQKNQKSMGSKLIASRVARAELCVPDVSTWGAGRS